MVNVHVNWLNWFLFLILVEGSLVIGCSLGEVKVGISPTFFIPTTAFLSAFYLFQVTPSLLVVFSIAWNESEFKTCWKQFSPSTYLQTICNHCLYTMIFIWNSIFSFKSVLKKLCFQFLLLFNTRSYN